MSILLGDAGNGGVRAMRHLEPSSYIAKPPTIIPNAVVWHREMPNVNENDNTWDDRDDSLTFSLKKGDINAVYTVGSSAQESRNHFSYAGVDKFSDNYLPILVASTLVKNHLGKKVVDGAEHEIDYGIMHPYNYTGDNLKQISNAVRGTYRIKYLDGRRVTFKIKQVYTLPETTGTASFIKPDSLYGNNVKDTRYCLLLDFGYGTTQSVVWDYKENKPISSTYRTFDIGSRDYVNSLAQYIAKEHMQKVNAMGDRVTIDARLFEAMRTGLYPIDAGDYIDVSGYVKEMKKSYARDFSGQWKASRFNQIVSVIAGNGGGAGFFMEDVVDMAFPKFTWDYNAKLVSKDLTELRLTNLYGFATKIGAWIKNNGG